mgnify:CR=1
MEDTPEMDITPQTQLYPKLTKIKMKTYSPNVTIKLMNNPEKRLKMKLNKTMKQV